jgi:hypothetical protein
MVVISDEAKTLLQQAPPETVRSKAELHAIYNRSQGASSPLWSVAPQINTYGKEAKALAELPRDASPERIAQAKKVADFVYRQHTTGNDTGDPYATLSREELCNIIYDESGNHTRVERYAAYGTRHDKDHNFLNKLMTHEGPSFYQGALDYHDAISPIERSHYPDSYREINIRFMKQAEQGYGADAGPSVWDILMKEYSRKLDQREPSDRQILTDPLPPKTTESSPPPGSEKVA